MTSIGGHGCAWQGGGQEAPVQHPDDGLHGEDSILLDRYGSVLWGAFWVQPWQRKGARFDFWPAQFVKRFLKSSKNDYVDSEAIAEAVQRPNMRFVPIKTQAQLDLQALHLDSEC
jgi:hypothetical protein